MEPHVSSEQHLKSGIPHLPAVTPRVTGAVDSGTHPLKQERRAKTPREWALAIYMVADGPSGNPLLDSIALEELSDILAAAIPEAGKTPNNDIYVALQSDLSDKNGILRLAVDGDVERIREENAADPETLDKFFEFVRKECPARHYAVLFWGHSSGPVGLFGDSANVASPITSVTLPKLERVMKQFANASRCLHDAKRACARDSRQRGESADDPMHAIDIIAFKNCWVATLETAYQLRGVAEWIIASQGKVPQQGWPYKKMLDVLSNAPCGRVEQVAANLVDALGSFYELAGNRPDKDEVPFCCINLDKVDAIGEALKDLPMLKTCAALFNGQHAAIQRSSTLWHSANSWGTEPLDSNKRSKLQLTAHRSQARLAV